MRRRNLLTRSGKALKKSLAIIALAAMVAAGIATFSLEAKANELGPAVYFFSDADTLLVYVCDSSLETVLLPDPDLYSNGPMTVTIFRIQCEEA